MWVQRWPFLIIIAPVVAASTFYGIHRYLAPERAKKKSGDEFLQEKQIAQVKKDILQITSQILVGITVLSGAYFTWQRLEVSREDQLTDRFTRAVDQLGRKEHLEVRLGGIYALERLAKDSPKDQETILELLAAYFRERASKQAIKPETNGEKNGSDSSNSDDEANLNQEHIYLSTDMQAILTILGRREWAITKSVDLSKVSLNQTNLREVSLSRTKLLWADLRHTTLIKADLRDANLHHSKLNCADLQGAILHGTYLREANLEGTNLGNANLAEADLMGAKLIKAHLTGANLTKTNLAGADLSEANLNSANLAKADLTNANLFNANLHTSIGITPSQIKAARKWDKAKYSKDFRIKLERPTESEGQPPSQN